MALLVACLLGTLAVAVTQGHPGCSERGAPDHGRVRVILQRAAGVMVAYSCDPGYHRTGHVYSVCIRGVWTTPLPACVPGHSGEVNDGAPRDQGVLVSHEELPSTQRTIAARRVPKTKQIRKKRKRKRKDKRMDSANIAGSDSSPESSLDASCLLSSTEGIPKFVRPPKVPNSLGPKFVRRKNEKQKYFVAIYRCLPGYKLHNPHSRSLGCQNNKWVGTLPICLPRRKKIGCINAGCEHDCKEVNGKPKCFCFKGFRQNGKYCIDQNECLDDNGGCQQSCHNTPGSFYCGCPPGYRLTNDRLTCVDVNECVSRNGHGPCQGQCHNVEGSFFCSCEGFPGSRLADDGVSCADIDECNDPDHRLGCSHACVNTRGSAFCLCPPGYELGTDWKTCQDVNECERDIARCELGCVNTIGSFACASQADCDSGYQRINSTCQDIDECVANATICSHSCLNTPGSFTCSCPNGFVLDQDGRTCIDIDECLEFSEGHLCSHICQNTPGSYNCLCPSDHELASDHRTCHPKEDECQRRNCTHDCVTEDSHAVCVCDEGYTLEDDVTCVDIDECEGNHAGCSHSCVNEEGTYYCTCPIGYFLLPDKKTCSGKECGLNICLHGCANESGVLSCACPRGYEKKGEICNDIDECEMGASLCSQGCRNSEGSFECYCNEGFYLDDDYRTCIDINECEENNLCSANEVCVNSEGTYSCTCSPGFREVNGTGRCEDIDECSFTVDEGSSLCSHTCINSLGSFHCECPHGYTMGKDSRTCVDVDECSENNEINTMCSHSCINSVGSYHCECPAGYTLEEDHICVAASGCKVNDGGCSHICIENDGYPICECPEGFILANDSLTCISHKCSSNNCFHQYDSHSRTCSLGYTYMEDVQKCNDINECLENNGNCAQRCENTEGSFYCACLAGFEEHLDSQTCVDVNECTKNISICDQICLNTEGSYKCGCHPGYKLSDNLTDCVDIDECVNNTVCNQTCLNLMGSFKCSCNPGFILSSDGVSCEDVNECSLNISNCSQICKNTDGGFSCDCDPGFILVNNSVCDKVNNMTTEEEECEHETVMIGQEKTCCCKVGYVIVNKTKCVHSSTCDQTVGCDLSSSESHTCVSNDVTTKIELHDANQQGCPPLLSNGSSVTLECKVVPERDIVLYPAGTECRVTCSPGYKLDGLGVTTCLSNGSWSGPVQCSAQIRPYIRCPPPIRLNLPLGRNSTNVNIPQPKTNMNWEKHVTSYPAWGKDLRTVLPFGTSYVQFSVVSPSSNYVAKCTVSIQIMDMERPTILSCPEDMKSILHPGKSSAAITWTEPLVKDNVQVAHLYQSQRPGVLLPKGTHKINYIAADSSGNIATCQFMVNVEDAVNTRLVNTSTHF